MKIGILVTNTDTSTFAQNHPRDGEKFTALVHGIRPQWQCAVYNCVEGRFPEHLAECDGYIIGGSPASVNDADPWIATLLSLIKKLDETHTPVVGCCFGHQAIAKALGGKVEKNPGGWGFGVAQTKVIAPKSWMSPQIAHISLYAAHTEQVTTMPPQAEIWGGSDFCPVGGFVIGHHVMTTEYHPEMTKDFFVGLIHAFEKYVGRNMAQEALRQSITAAQGPLFAEWMANFFEQSCVHR
ncbi:MAG: type 1 glutamine amidotransferase [Alphaproteobacteria bacterium]|nr:type 1 glutamine amidotransferase [Alphaproteobacteria bacterium]